MIKARPQHAKLLDFIQIEDFGTSGSLDEAVKGVDGIVHVASPFTYDTEDNEKELIIPAMNGVRSVLEAAARTTTVKRIVITSSFAAVMDANRKAPPYFTYTADDWNPLSYAEAADPSTSAVIAYRGSKKFAEQTAWDFVRERKPSFDIATLCPPMTFGPIVHPVDGVGHLNESNAMLWKVASGEKPLPVARVPFWVDVRDLALAHVEALLRSGAGGKRFLPAAPERFSYALAAKIAAKEFDWAKENVSQEDQVIDESYGVDGETASKELGVTYRSFKQTVMDLITQVAHMQSEA
ncbi:NAD dependent epimerase/dehydratase [Coniochaeta hoffmannii]|uniref:NAD dependent epimerase/dehydratase n=1 Tax=Coniochaeta hoffmannii TaxID=91930 RepID=A0AA38VQ80_9PEZI|nr:NAD dependent epimerase/dehydratase [Coniochaeta hoffmannii]